jgi:hypothetical protein
VFDIQVDAFCDVGSLAKFALLLQLICTRFFVTTMAALKVANTAALRAAQHERLHESLALAGTVGWKNTEDSPSLELLRLNLSQHLREAKQT